MKSSIRFNDDDDLIKSFIQCITVPSDYEAMMYHSKGDVRHHLDTRREMKLMITQMLDNCTDECLRKIKSDEITKSHVKLAMMKKSSGYLSKQIEEELYNQAPSLESYMDSSTLICRIKPLLSGILSKEDERRTKKKRSSKGANEHKLLTKQRHEILVSFIGNDTYVQILETIKKIKKLRNANVAWKSIPQDAFGSDEQPARKTLRPCVAQLYLGTELELAMHKAENCAECSIAMNICGENWNTLLSQAQGYLSTYDKLLKDKSVGAVTCHGSCGLIKSPKK